MNDDILPPSEDPNINKVNFIQVSPNLSSNDYTLKENNLKRTKDLSANDESQSIKKKKALNKSSKPAIPEWFSSSNIHSIEIQFLPEFFSPENANTSRNSSTYLRIRNLIHNLYQQSPNVYLSATEVRKKVSGDVCTMIRIHEFLDAFGVINYNIKPDMRPSYAPFIPLNINTFQSGLGDTNSGISSVVNNQILGGGGISNTSESWPHELDHDLIQLVSNHDANWDAIADELNSKVVPSLNITIKLTPSECVRRFVELPLFQKLNQIEKFPASGSGSDCVGQNGETISSTPANSTHTLPDILMHDKVEALAHLSSDCFSDKMRALTGLLLHQMSSGLNEKDINEVATMIKNVIFFILFVTFFIFHLSLINLI